jgi:hypothetical protein
MPRKQKKGKSKDSAPKSSPSEPASQKIPNTKLILRVPPFSGAKAQPQVRAEATPETGPEVASGALQPDEDSDISLSEIPFDHDASPRQQIINHYWDHCNVTDTQESDQNGDLPNEAASHSENSKDPGLPGPSASRKRKASTESAHSLERTNRDGRSSSVNPGSRGDRDESHSDSSDMIIQPAVSKKARKTPREAAVLVEVASGGTDEEVEMVVTKGRQARKPSKKDRAVRNTNRHSDDDSEEEGSYKNST